MPVPATTRCRLPGGEHLTLGYRVEAVVRDASLELKAGPRPALVGPNRSGKSTLLRARSHRRFSGPDDADRRAIHHAMAVTGVTASGRHASRMLT